VKQYPCLEHVIESNVMGIHERRKATRVKNALEDADLEVHSESLGQQVRRMEAMVMQIGAAVGVHLVLDAETDCIRPPYAGEASASAPRPHAPREREFRDPGRGEVRKGATLH
jgi:hypothetical protein